MEEPQTSTDNAFEKFCYKKEQRGARKRGNTESNCFPKQKMYFIHWFISRTQYFFCLEICYCEIKVKKCSTDCNTKCVISVQVKKQKLSSNPPCPRLYHNLLFRLQQHTILLFITITWFILFKHFCMFHPSGCTHIDIPSFHFHYCIALHWMDTKMHLFIQRLRCYLLVNSTATFLNVYPGALCVLISLI